MDWDKEQNHLIEQLEILNTVSLILVKQSHSLQTSP